MAASSRSAGVEAGGGGVDGHAVVLVREAVDQGDDVTVKVPGEIDVQRTTDGDVPDVEVAEPTAIIEAQRRQPDGDVADRGPGHRSTASAASWSRSVTRAD